MYINDTLYINETISYTAVLRTFFLKSISFKGHILISHLLAHCCIVSGKIVFQYQAAINWNGVCWCILFKCVIFCGATDTPVLDFWWRLLSGFQSQSGQPYLHLAEAYMRFNPGATPGLLTFWQPAWWLVTVPQMHFSAGVGSHIWMRDLWHNSLTR